MKKTARLGLSRAHGYLNAEDNQNQDHHRTIQRIQILVFLYSKKAKKPWCYLGKEDLEKTEIKKAIEESTTQTTTQITTQNTDSSKNLNSSARARL